MPSTIVSFADGSLTGDGVVTRVETFPEGVVVVVDASPFHPVDHLRGPISRATPAS